MSQKDHYVSQFHLRQFLDPLSIGTRDPWVWVGDIPTGKVKRRAPKKFAWSRGMFDGPGGLEDETKTLEDHLACEVEPAAAKAIWSFIREPHDKRKELPPSISRYVAWAAARSLTWTALIQEWLDATGLEEHIDAVEPPPPGMEIVKGRNRLHRMEHPDSSIRDDVRSDEILSLQEQGWKWKLKRDDFLEMIHIQAWYFQVRFFPRLRWIALEAPEGKSFVIGDRPVVWGVDGFLDIPPSALRNKNVQLIAPISNTICLFAHHAEGSPPNGVMPEDINVWMAFAARKWIVGSNEQTVLETLQTRTSMSKGVPG